MEKRLDDTDLSASYDAGHQSLKWVPSPVSGLLSGIDLEAIAESSQAADIVAQLPVQPLYYALKQRGFDESLDILPHLTDEQMTHMVDYEAWDGDEFSRRRFFNFLKPFAAISAGELFRRFSELDEEYQIAAFENIFEVYEVEHMYDLPPGVEERAFAMPCNKVFYEIKLEDQDDVAFVEKVLESARANNMRYAYALLGHSTFNPPGENEYEVGRFRKARLEEDGFVSYEESLRLFTPVDRESLGHKWLDTHPGHSKDALFLQQGTNLTFLDACLIRAQEQGAEIDDLFQVHQSLLYLANALASAARVAVDDAQGLSRVLEQGKALVSLGLECLADGSLELGSRIVLKEYPKTLFQVGYGLIEEMRAETVKVLTRLKMPRAAVLARAYGARQWGQMLLELDRNWLDVLGAEATEILKGLMNRFPMVAVASPDDSNRIIFKPIASLADYYELELSIQAVMAYIACVSMNGGDLQIPFELTLRNQATASLRRGMSSGEWNDIEGSTQQLLNAWRDTLRSQSAQWMLGQNHTREEALGLAMSMVHDCLHGLIVIPEGPRRSPREEEFYS